MTFRDTYLAAADAFADLVVRLPADRWDGPGLGKWTLRELVGHVVSSALRQVPVVLANPAGHQEVLSPEGYWAVARTVPPDILEVAVAVAVAASTEDARLNAEELGEGPLLLRALTGRAALPGEFTVV